MNTLVQERTLTELDHVRLSRLLQRAGADSHPLADLLDIADILPSKAVPPNLVTMNSRVRLLDLTSQDTLEITVRYPADADPAAGALSVLSPLGTQLVGLRVGDVARWTTPDHAEHAARLEAVLFQPESEGDYLA
jgi:regulator of nucleoside diphosphate kinase